MTRCCKEVGTSTWLNMSHGSTNIEHTFMQHAAAALRTPRSIMLLQSVQSVHSFQVRFPFSPCHHCPVTASNVYQIVDHIHITGRAYKQTCPVGVIFDPQLNTCATPDQARDTWLLQLGTKSLQSQRRLLLGHSPGWKRLPVLSHSRNYQDINMLNRCLNTVSRHEIGTPTQRLQGTGGLVSKLA